MLIARFWTLRRTAALLRRRGAVRKDLPRILFLTDPERTPDIAMVAARLPKGAAVVFRAFGATDAEAQARALRELTRRLGLRLLIGADAGLARRVRADGVHLPERLAHQALPLRRARPSWIITVAAHSVRAARRAPGADAVVLSTAFPSASPSAGRALGPIRLAMALQAGGRPAYALGGISEVTAGRLSDLPLAGLAAVSAL